MIKHNQDGAVNGVVLSLILTMILLLGAIGFAAWAFSSREDYKNNTDAKISVAVQAAKTQESTAKDKQFAEEIKNPLQTYNGPEPLGSVIFQYPKTWNGYVNISSGSGGSLDSYFAPGILLSPGGASAPLAALRVRVLPQSYTSVAQSFASSQHSGKVTISAYALPKLPNIIGIKVSGIISGKTTGTAVILPLRSQTVEIETEGTQYLTDFNNYILPNFSFSP